MEGPYSLLFTRVSCLDCVLPEGAENDIRSLDPKLQVTVNGLCGRWGMNSILWKSIKRHLYIPVKSVLFVLLCLHVTVWLYMHVCARRPEEEWDPWSWRYRDLWTTRPVMWELGCEPGSSQLCSQCFESLSHLSPQLRILNLYTCFFHKICEKF